MKLKTMDIQKFLFTGWCPKMAHNMTIDATIDTFNILEIRNNQKYNTMENTVKICNLEINGFIHDGDTDILDLHYEDEFFLWGAETEKEYKEAENRIGDFVIEKDLYTVWMWEDIRGFRYWMRTMEESNYIQVTVSFKSENFPLDKLKELREDLDIAVAEAKRISEIYNWSPESYLK